MTKRLRRGNLQVSEILTNFIENEALPDTNISSDMFWEKLETINPPTAPIKIASIGDGASGSAVIATSPPSAPFKAIVKSVFL